MGRHVVTGLGPDGRSTVISAEDKATFAVGGFDDLADDPAISANRATVKQSIARLYECDDPTVGERPATGYLLPIGIKPGGALWLEMKFDGPYETEFHRTDSIDFHTMVGGEVELILETGSITLRTGDTVLVPGVIHRWRSAAIGHSSLLVIGMEPA